MKLSLSGFTSVVRAVSAITFAEILLAYLVSGYSDFATISLIIFISILLMLLGSINYYKQGDEHVRDLE